MRKIHHHHDDPDASDARVIWAIAANLSLTIAEIIGGILSGSLALIADALHNLSDAISLVIALLARKIARRPADDVMTFGYGRAEIVAALVNYTTLIIVGLYLVYEAAMRFLAPSEVDGWLIVVVAGIALAVDVVTAFLTYQLSKNSMNIRAAFLHNVADALGSIAVILVGTMVLLYDWQLVDPLVTVLIASYILWMSFIEIGGAIRILMLGSPTDLDPQAVIAAIKENDGVAAVHHLHLWQMQEHESALDAHIVIARDRWTDADAIKQAVKSHLQSSFGIAHTTLELECFRHACIDPMEIGHATTH